MLTNEQCVVQAEKEILNLKEDYIAVLTPIANKYQTDKKSISLNDFLQCQQSGNRYFNHVEQLVGDSGLLGAHINGKWVTGFAETCHSVLESFVIHMTFLRSWSSTFDVGGDIEPNSNAYANMQRMVIEYLPKRQSRKLKQKFIEAKLPVAGFQYKSANDMEKTHLWKEIVAIIIAIFFILGAIYFTFTISPLSEIQIFVIRAILSIGLAMLGFLIPGLLNVESRFNRLRIKATGAIAIFIIVWLYNPPSLLTQ